MRWAGILRTFALFSTSLLLAASPASADEVELEEADKDEPRDSFDRPIRPSTFNGQTVPPLEEINGDHLDTHTKDGYWLVEFFSPYCHHCKDFAPILQTVYEFYYSSGSLIQANDVKSTTTFSDYYAFNFGRVNCIQFGNLCAAKNISAFPTLILFKNTEPVGSPYVASRDVQETSDMMEELLETIKPGTRPAKKSFALPAVGDDHVDVKNVKKGTENDTKDKITSKVEETTKGKASKAEAVLAGDDKKDKVTAKVDKKTEGKASNAEAVLADSSSKVVKSLASATLRRKNKSRPIPTERASINANLLGRSVPLDLQAFKGNVSMTRNPWLVKFFAPWCPHCQALAPIWNQMAKDLIGKVNIGHVNCDVEKQLCKDAGINAYPALYMYQGKDRVEYDGLRGLGDLIAFGKKAAAISVGLKDVTAVEFEALEKEEEVIFLYMYDLATTSEDFIAIERLLMPIVGKARLVKSSDEKLSSRFKINTWPRLLVSRDGKPSYYLPLAPKDMRDHGRVLDWMKSVWLPLVPELTPANAQEIMKNKLVVMGILSRDRADEFIIAKREIKNAAIDWMEKEIQAFRLERQELRDAKQLRIEEAEDRNDEKGLSRAKEIHINMNDVHHKEVIFTWVDGVFWDRWIRTTYGINVKDGERVIINDEEYHHYWDMTITRNPIVPSRSSILETLREVVATPPRLRPKSTASFLGHIYYAIRRAFHRHPVLTSGAVVIFLVFLALQCRAVGSKSGNNPLTYGSNGGAAFNEKKPWGNGGGFFNLPLSNGKDSSGTLGGLLGGGAPEKAD